MAAVSARVSENDFLQAALALFPEALHRTRDRAERGPHQIRQLKKRRARTRAPHKAQSAMPLALLLAVAAVTSPLEELLEDVDALQRVLVPRGSAALASLEKSGDGTGARARPRLRLMTRFLWPSTRLLLKLSWMRYLPRSQEKKAMPQCTSSMRPRRLKACQRPAVRPVL